MSKLKTKGKGKPKPKKKSNLKSFTLETPVVKALLVYDSIPWPLRQNGEKTNEEFCRKWGLKTNQSLCNYRQIKGYWEAKQTLAKKFHAYYDSVADDSLLKLAEGVLVQKRVWDYEKRCYKDEVFSEKPCVKACKEIKRIFGGFIDKLEIDEPLLAAIKKRAKAKKDK